MMTFFFFCGTLFGAAIYSASFWWVLEFRMFLFVWVGNKREVDIFCILVFCLDILFVKKFASETIFECYYDTHLLCLPILI